MTINSFTCQLERDTRISVIRPGYQYFSKKNKILPSVRTGTGIQHPTVLIRSLGSLQLQLFLQLNDSRVLPWHYSNIVVHRSTPHTTRHRKKKQLGAGLKEN